MLVDGFDLTSLDAAWYRRQLGVVSQEPKLFSMDVASNIRYGCHWDVTDAEVVEAAQAANAHTFIMDLPQGYQTPVTDK